MNKIEELFQKLMKDIDFKNQQGNDIQFSNNKIQLNYELDCGNLNIQEENDEFINQHRLWKSILNFLERCIKFEQNRWICHLCKSKFERGSELVKHAQKSHLIFLHRLLLGQKDKCFSLNCHHRKNKLESESYDIKSHLETAHSQIYQNDRIFSKLYKGIDGANKYFYGYDQKHWKTKFEEHLEMWLEEVDSGSDQFIKDSQVFLNKRGDRLLEYLRYWMENDEGLKQSEVERGLGDFDQLCYFLKMSWMNLFDQEEKESIKGLEWISDKLLNEPRRIFMIETFSNLLNTKQSYFAQLHRYLYLGVFNFKQSQNELTARIQSLENYIKQLVIFSAFVFNNECFSESCLFEDILCSKKNNTFKSHLQMYQHYNEGHVGVMYALSNEQLIGNLQIVKADNVMNGQFKNVFSILELGEFIHYLHDYHKADYKSRSKRFMWMARKYFQLKCICSDCNKELYHFGEVYWKENQEGVLKEQLKFKHKQLVREVIEVYKGGQQQWSEMTILKDQSELYKLKMLKTSMQSEILFDDKGRQSQCKECHKQLKGFNPLLKELKEEYFKLPLNLKEDNKNKEDQKQGNNINRNQFEIKDDDPRFMRVQKSILNRMIETNESTDRLNDLKQQMEGGYFRINSFPKLVQIYGEISESVDQNPKRVLSQPILTGYMKVIFQTPLIYIPQTSIIYEMQPQWAKVRHQFKLFGSSDLQRREFIDMLEAHPIIQNHTYQMTNLTNLCINQVDLIFQLNKHLWKQTSKLRIEEMQQIQREKLGQELTKTSDLLYFKSVLHRAQVQLLLQQFRIWLDVFEILKLKIEHFIIEEQRQNLNGIERELLDKLNQEFNKFTYNNDINKVKNNLHLMLILSFFYCEGAYRQQNLEIKLKLSRGTELNWDFLDFILKNEMGGQRNAIRFLFESHLLPIITPLIQQYIHPIFIGTLLQIFSLDMKRKQQNVIQENEGNLQLYLNAIFNRLSKLTIKRCIPLFNFKKNSVDEKEVKNESEEQQQRKDKLEREGRLFQLKLFIRLDQQQQIDMQCRYVLAKRSLIKVMNSKKEDPMVDCDLRWAMQIAKMFFSSIRKRSSHGNDDEMRVARENVKQLKELKEELDHYFSLNKSWIPEDFLFKTYNPKKNHNTQNKKSQGKQELASDLRSLLEEILKEDQLAQINQVFNQQNGYKFIHRLKIAFFIPMEKKLQDIIGCIAKLRSLPHRQTYRSYEKFHRYNFRELEMLAFPELFVTGQGFLQHLAPKIERNQIVIAIDQKDKQQAQDVLANLKQFKMKQKQQEHQQGESDITQNQSNNNVLQLRAEICDFTTQYRQGQQLPCPKKAVLELEKEKYIKSELSAAYIYDMQKISVIKVFQEASESVSIAEKSFKLDQNIEIKISGEQVLGESLKNDHVLKNFKQILMNQQTWSNECQTFINRMRDEAKEKGIQQNQSRDIDKGFLEYIRLQEKLFLEKKRQELADQFKNFDLQELETLRQQHLDIKKTKLKKSKNNNKSKGSFSDMQEEIHSEVIQQIHPLDEMTERIQKEVATFSTQFTSIGEDTKYRLLNKATRIFNNRFSFVFWRYTQRYLQRIFSYYAVVNGINFYEKQQTTKKIGGEQKELKELQKLPPTKGSNSFLKLKYKEQRAISFQKGTPFLFNTYTLNEFDHKTQKLVQGLNFFDLEDDDQLKRKQKFMDKRLYNTLQKEFTIYFYYLSKILTQCLMNKVGIFKTHYSDFKLYDFGMYGLCRGYANRFEFQQRGTIHLHQLLYFEKNDDGQIEEKILEYWSAIFSLWNCNKKECDRSFINKYRLEHVCDQNCIKADSDNSCRKGYPFQLNPKSSWNRDYCNQIFARIQNDFESRIFMHDRDVIKFFGSSCVIEACGNDKIIDYITKYMNKESKYLEDQDVPNEKIKSQKFESDSEIDEMENLQIFENKLPNKNTQGEIQEETQLKKDNNDVDNTLKKQAQDLIQKVFSKKVTSISEAYSDLLDYPIFKTNFTCVKIAQVPLSEQFSVNWKNIQDYFDIENPDQDLKTNMKSSIWIKYLCRPEELEFLTLMEYIQNFIWYGGKSRYKKQAEIKIDKNIYLLDQNGQIIKQREKAIDHIVKLSQIYYLEELNYSPNLFYLAMLQLFWSHRQESWLRETKDTYEGYKEAYYRFYNSIERRFCNEIEQVKSQYLEKFGSFSTFKEAVDNYKKLSNAQQKFLNSIQFAPKRKISKNQQDEEKKKLKQCKQYFTYHSLLRAKNSIFKVSRDLDEEGETFVLCQEVKGILNYLRPDVLISMSQKEEILKVQDQLIAYIQNHQEKWRSLTTNQKCIIEELSSLLKTQRFEGLQEFIFQSSAKKIQEPASSHKKQNTIFSQFEQSSTSQVSQLQIEQFLTSTDENIEFPQHFRTTLSRSEFKTLIRPRLNSNLFDACQISEELEDIFQKQLNNQQKLAVLILIHKQQRRKKKLFLKGVSFMVVEEQANPLLFNFYQGSLKNQTYHILFFVLHKFQSKIQFKQNQMTDRIMTIHSFFHLQHNTSIDCSFDHFLAFLKFINKEELYQNSTSQLYPELLFYNCMHKTERFTKKLQGVRTIILEEISMIPPNFISLLDIYLQVSLSNNLPFGGIQIFAFGDSFQLQPVTKLPTYFFQGHVFKGNFFSLYLELTTPVRQSNDLLFYNEILQPIRMGKFQDHENFRNSLRLLRMRHLSSDINNQTQFNLSQGLQMQVQRLQADNEIQFLYFDNEAVQRENQIRAEQHIRAQELKYQNQKEKFRVFLNSPARLSFGIKSSHQDQLLINIVQDYELIQEFIEGDQSLFQSYALHFKLLPLTIRNYLMQSFLPHAYESIKINNKGFKFPEKIKLFQNAQIIFRKNLDKSRRMINGQAGIITDLQFELDFKSEEMRKKQNQEKDEKISSNTSSSLKQ